MRGARFDAAVSTAKPDRRGSTLDARGETARTWRMAPVRDVTWACLSTVASGHETPPSQRRPSPRLYIVSRSEPCAIPLYDSFPRGLSTESSGRPIARARSDRFNLVEGGWGGAWGWDVHMVTREVMPLGFSPGFRGGQPPSMFPQKMLHREGRSFGDEETCSELVTRA